MDPLCQEKSAVLLLVFVGDVSYNHRIIKIRPTQAREYAAENRQNRKRNFKLRKGKLRLVEILPRKRYALVRRRLNL
jgi:hypothetical protein